MKLLSIFRRIFSYFETILGFKSCKIIFANYAEENVPTRKERLKLTEYVGLPFTFYRYRQFAGVDHRTQWQKYRYADLPYQRLGMLELLFLSISATFYIGKIWPCGMEVSIRGTNLILHCRHTPPNFLMRYLINRHYNFVLANPEDFGDNSNNHFLTCITFLTICECMSGTKNTYSSKPFLQQFDCADGVNFENSTHYHDLATELLLIVYLLKKDRALGTLLQKALAFCEFITIEESILLTFGDSDESSFITMSDGKPQKPLISKLKDNSYDQILKFLTNRDTSDLPPVESYSSNITLLENSGFILVKKTGYRCMVRVAPDYQQTFAHSHPDIGSFEIYDETGYYSTLKGLEKYTENKLSRQTILGTPRKFSVLSMEEDILHAFDGYDYKKEVTSYYLHAEILTVGGNKQKNIFYFNNDKLKIIVSGQELDYKECLYHYPSRNYGYK